MLDVSLIKSQIRVGFQSVFHAVGTDFEDNGSGIVFFCFVLF